MSRYGLQAQVESSGRSGFTVEWGCKVLDSSRLLGDARGTLDLGDARSVGELSVAKISMFLIKEVH